MDTPAPVAKQQAAEPKKPMTWDEYFPLINKAIMFVILALALLFVSGIDITQLAGRIMNRDSEQTQVVSATASLGLGGGFKWSSLSVTGPGGWKVIVGLIVALGSLVALVFGILSASGRDAAWTKEQQAKLKEDQKPKPSNQSGSSEPESTECNLSSYKLFFGPKDEPAATTAEAATPSTSA